MNKKLRQKIKDRGPRLERDCTQVNVALKIFREALQMKNNHEIYI